MSAEKREFVFRSLPVKGEHYKAIVEGRAISPKDPYGSQTIRDHVLYGSKADFTSQFISTTKSIHIAAKYAVPVHTIVAIDLCKYRAHGKNVFDLSSQESFTQNVSAK
jgi:hypothetical protein